MAVKLASAAAQYLADPTGFRRDWSFPTLLWETAEEEPEAESSTVTTHAARVVERPRAGDPLLLEVRKGSHALNAVAHGVTIGRTSNNDIVLFDPTVSRFHALLREDEKTHRWLLEDAESQNGTWVGELKLSPRSAVAVVDGAKLRFGAVQVTFLLPAGLVRMLDARLASARGG